MKLFISADIEGCAGLVLPAETHKQESIYRPFAEEMTKEVLAACEAAHEMGADEIVVKDGHGDATNIDPFQMPEYVTLIRGKSGHPYNMMWGIDDSFDGVIFIGYHAPAGDPRFPVSHTSTGNSLYIAKQIEKDPVSMLTRRQAMGCRCCFYREMKRYAVWPVNWCRGLRRRPPNGEKELPWCAVLSLR